MAASARSPASRDDPAAAYADDLALNRRKFEQRLPASLDELQGPARGAVHLPLHVWQTLRRLVGCANAAGVDHRIAWPPGHSRGGGRLRHSPGPVPGLPETDEAHAARINEP